MPRRPGKACRQTGCNNIANHNQHQGYCEQHKGRAGWYANESEKGNRHQRGYGWAWNKLRNQALNRDNHLCQMCIKSNKATAATQVDHIKPKTNGGADELDNLQSLCTACHREKTAHESSKQGVVKSL